MIINLNGEKREAPDGLTVEGLLKRLNIQPQRVAVELNEVIVRKGTYETTALKDGDRIEVVAFMGGGIMERADRMDQVDHVDVSSSLPSPLREED